MICTFRPLSCPRVAPLNENETVQKVAVDIVKMYQSINREPLIWVQTF